MHHNNPAPERHVVVTHSLGGPIRTIAPDDRDHLAEDAEALLAAGELLAALAHDPSTLMLCSQCGELEAAMMKVGTQDGWCSACLDRAAEHALGQALQAKVDEWREAIASTKRAGSPELTEDAELIVADFARLLGEPAPDGLDVIPEALRRPLGKPAWLDGVDRSQLGTQYDGRL